MAQGQAPSVGERPHGGAPQQHSTEPAGAEKPAEPTTAEEKEAAAKAEKEAKEEAAKAEKAAKEAEEADKKAKQEASDKWIAQVQLVIHPKPDLPGADPKGTASVGGSRVEGQVVVVPKEEVPPTALGVGDKDWIRREIEGAQMGMSPATRAELNP